MGPKSKDYTGQRFNKLVAIRQTGKRTSSGNAIWELRCDCGNIRLADTGKLSNGAAKSCGCSLKTQFECRAPGCKAPAKAKHLCNRHYKREFVFTPKTSLDVQERLALKTKRTSDGCIEWTGGLTGSGYAQTFVKGKRISVHRLVYESHNGKIPDGLFVCHKCDNPKCCNIDHLFLGTQSDNIRDAWNKGRGRAPWQQARD